MKPSEVIDKILDDVLSTEDKWLQGMLANAEVKDGEIVATKFCAVGAIRVAATGSHMRANDLTDRVNVFAHHVVTELGELNVPAYNDATDRTYQDIRALFEKTRAKLWEAGE